MHYIMLTAVSRVLPEYTHYVIKSKDHVGLSFSQFIAIVLNIK